jgi:sugar lactone lactonase YvrE
VDDGCTKDGPNYSVIQGLTFAPSGVLYSVDYPAGLLYTVNTTTAKITRAPNPSFETNFTNGECSGLTFAPDDNLFASDVTGNIYSIKLANGLGTKIGSASFPAFTEALAANLAPLAPLPGTLPATLACLAALGCCAAMRKHRCH